MTYLAAAAVKEDATVLREASPEVWRQVRRYNLPVQLALAAASDIVPLSSDPATLAVFSLAPCQSGSPELYDWVHVVTSGISEGNLGEIRMNPTLTLHAVDNLAMSAFAINHRNHSYNVGLGGAAGQAWVALEAVQERLAAGHETEALLMAGDQKWTEGGVAGMGVAFLFSASPKRYALSGHIVKLVAVERDRRPHRDSCVPHAAAGLFSLMSTIAEHAPGRLLYHVPFEHSDGIDAVTVSVEIWR